jgi:hypothetical protein
MSWFGRVGLKEWFEDKKTQPFKIDIDQISGVDSDFKRAVATFLNLVREYNNTNDYDTKYVKYDQLKRVYQRLLVLKASPDLKKRRVYTPIVSECGRMLLVVTEELEQHERDLEMRERWKDYGLQMMQTQYGSTRYKPMTELRETTREAWSADEKRRVTSRVR